MVICFVREEFNLYFFQDFSFAGLSSLERLELSDCRIWSVSERAFAGNLHALEWIKLDGNRIAHLAPAHFAPVDSAGLHGLDLHGNPWNCTCSLRPLRDAVADMVYLLDYYLTDLKKFSIRHIIYFQ